MRDLKGIIELRETVSKRMLHVTVPTMNIMGVSRTTMAGMKMSLTMHSENGRSSATHEERQTAAATKTTTARPIKRIFPYLLVSRLRDEIAPILATITHAPT